MAFDLNTLWFVLIGVLFTGYFVLEGFDFGVGILLPFVAKEDEDRRMVINSIGPFWDGNEVWILTGGGAIFAAFPNWYATMFSGFYIALFLMLFGLIIRAVAFEYRSKSIEPSWRKTWDWVIFTGSFIPALLWGVALANILKGVPIDETMTYTGGFFNLLNIYALLGGLASLTVFTTHGGIFLALKTSGTVRDNAIAAIKKVGPIATVMVLLFAIGGYLFTNAFASLGVNPGAIPILALLSLLSVGWLINNDRFGWGFIMSAVTILLSTASVFMALYPNVMVSSLNPEWNLTIYNASSSPYTLTVMSWEALIFVPIVLIYQGWTYYTFRERLTKETELEY